MPTQKRTTPTGQTVALTGATGFLGGHVQRLLLEKGYSVKSLTRRPQEPASQVQWIVGDLTDEATLKELCEGSTTLIHVAGLTKALDRNTFFDVNVGGSLTLFKAADAMGVEHVLHISSLAARKPELSHYGASKAGSELLLTARKWAFSWTILRPPAIYGPGDKEILKLLKTTKLGLLPAPGNRKNRFSMIHAVDLAAAIVELVEDRQKLRILEIDDQTNEGYSYSDVANALAQVQGKTPKIVPVPFALLGFIGYMNELMAKAIHRPAMLTLSTARYLSHSDWVVRDSFRPRLKNWSPQFDLSSGIRNTIEWYQKNNLL